MALGVLGWLSLVPVPGFLWFFVSIAQWADCRCSVLTTGSGPWGAWSRDPGTSSGLFLGHKWPQESHWASVASSGKWKMEQLAGNFQLFTVQL